MVGLDQLKSPVETIQIQSDFNHPEQAKIMCLSDDSNGLTSKKLSNYIAKCAREFKGKTLGLFTSFESLLESKRDIQKQLSDPYINVIAQSLKAKPAV